jgi:glutamate 5-kinase
MRDLKSIKRVILKIGSSSIVNGDLSINYKLLDSLMNSFKKLQDDGIQLVLVTSGAIALGRSVLGLKNKPKTMALKQACAAIGQAKLMEEYNNIGQKYNVKCGQILLNHDDFQIRKRLKFLEDCLEECLKNNVIPIINENDALAVEEIKVGDNDTLSSLLVPVINADLLILFSDIDGLYDKNPKEFDDAKFIDTVDKVDSNIYKMVGVNKSNVGTGGMETKLNAAIIATQAQGNMIICNSNRIIDLEKIIEGAEIGTLFKAKKRLISLREHWMIYRVKASGSIVIDTGAINALNEKKLSILPKGIISVNGNFLSDSIINVISEDGKLIAKGISNYSSDQIDLIKGKKSNEFLGKKYLKEEVIHANNLVIIREDILC